jgi:putative ribosome biogenesis GTPase RsgA
MKHSPSTRTSALNYSFLDLVPKLVNSVEFLTDMATFEFGAESARLDRDTYKEVTDDADQIRLVILGQSGIGKSTIVSRVFGIPEEEVRKHFIQPNKI